MGVEMKYSSIKINKPFYIGMSILDLSNWHMYNFHYNVMKPILVIDFIYFTRTWIPLFMKYHLMMFMSN